MSDDYYIGCEQCKESLWIAQSSNHEPPITLYSGEADTMEQLRRFIYKHFRHPLVIEFSDLLYDRYVPDNEQD